MKQIMIPGTQGNLAVLEAGHGSDLPIVFLHADSGRASQWAEVLEGIGQDRRVYALDSRGSGDSSPAINSDYSYEGRAEDISDLVATLELERFVIVAHSGSGAVALEYAAKHVDQVAGIFLLDPATDPRAIPTDVRASFLQALKGPASLDAQKAFFASIAGNNAQTKARVLEDCASVDAAARLGFATALANWNPESALDAWKGPIFLLVSVPNDNPNALHVLRPTLPHAVVAGSGHWIQLDQPHRLEQEIRRFMTSIE
ncbi:alpha/beta hydrolase [Sphingomonas sp. So64.6b]|uniref:alpha/beta fold hydrolase n=1 Tax=Sphingomonas sp. So64.6b TaxID=2997354 RepID=UPI0016043A54|nr:alpha/beta hydrolase [Sphingomonas sp. So64.6b]QNA82612.1 alpha/beta hydrolase [Sphingomonas sp. So64.6b]